jgi:transposase
MTACQFPLLLLGWGCETAETRSTRGPWEVEDALWERIEPLLPVVERNYRHPGRKRLENRQVLCGILFVLYTGIPWRFLPQELGFGSGMTCWRRLRDWNDAGVWQRLHELLLGELRAAGMLDFSRAAVDSSHLRAMKGGPGTGPSPVDRAKPGSKHHIIVEAHGIPLATTLTGGNRNDVTQLIPLIQAVPPIRGKAGQPLQRPRRIYADRGYDHEVYRDQVRRFQITPIIARRGTEHGSGLGVHRWVVEAAFALLHWFRRLRIRWERRDDIHQAFMTLGCAIICWRRLKNSF